MKVLIVDDEPPIVDSLERRLRREGFSTFGAGNAEDAVRLVRQVKPDLILLDVNLPGRSGFELCQTIRQDSGVPIIFVTARTDSNDIVSGLDAGGDDYIVKPFRLGEVAARCRAVLRRAMGEAGNEVIETNNLVIDPDRHVATHHGVVLPLSPKEFALLHFLARHQGQVFSREILLDRVWGNDTYVAPRTVDVHMRWLREKLGDLKGSPRRLVTVRGVGYKFMG
jgi:DNA-binding response OmpR family regulator